MNESNLMLCALCDKEIDLNQIFYKNEQITVEYLQEIMRDQKIVTSLGNLIPVQIKRLLEREIMITRHMLFHKKYKVKEADTKDRESPSSSTLDKVMMTDKIFIPVHLNPQYNFVGRILGPGGMTLKQIEREFDCRIKIRGKGSIRNDSKTGIQKKGDRLVHLDEDLHVLLTVTGEEQVSMRKLKAVKYYIKSLLDEAVSKTIGEDEEKQMQLMEYAILRGTYREKTFQSYKRHLPYDDVQTQAPKIPKHNQGFIPARVLPSPAASFILYNQLATSFPATIFSQFNIPRNNFFDIM